MTTAAPFDTHLEPRELARPNRYFDRISLNYFNRNVIGFPALVVGFRVNVEGATWSTLYHSCSPNGGTGNYRVGLRLFDIDDATALIDVFASPILTPLSAAVNVVDLPLTVGLGTSGKVWRLVAVLFEINNTGGLLSATCNARLFSARGRRGDE